MNEVRNMNKTYYMIITSFKNTFNLRAPRSRVSRVKVNNQRLLGTRTLESLSVLVHKLKIRGSLSNSKVECAASRNGGGRSKGGCGHG